jgi:tetratricopeptide (TPR) repeat protein
MGRSPKLSLTRQKRKGGAGDALTAAQVITPDETARLLVDVEAFLRLGLVDKAIEHLASAVHGNPALRVLREPLVKLYVAQGQPELAVEQLRALLSHCEDPHQEIRYLRYLRRLGERTPATDQRLKDLLIQMRLESPKSSEDALEPRQSVSEVNGALRAYLGSHRPPSDLALTRDLPELEALRYLSDAEPPASAVTRPGTDEVEEVAEEIALSSGGLKDQLQEVDDCLRELRLAEARRRLRALSARYPHSKRVRDRLQQLERAQSEINIDDEPPPAGQTAAPDIHNATTLPNFSLKATAKKLADPSAQAPMVSLRRTTVEITPEDIKEERALRTPPPPPKSGSLRRDAVTSDAARAFRTASTMRSFGQHKQAIKLFEEVGDDPTYGALAALLTGLCYRELNRPQEAIAALMLGVNSREAGEATLSELLYELGYTYEMIANPGEAILFYQLSLGTAGSFRDAAERILAQQEALRTT